MTPYLTPTEEREQFLAAMVLMELNESEALAECRREGIKPFFPIEAPQWELAP